LDLETVGFVIGLVGAICLKSSLNIMRGQRVEHQLALLKTIGREPEEPAMKAFLRGVVLVVLGLGVETYARLFVN
jgi:hypothetical protein